MSFLFFKVTSCVAESLIVINSCVAFLSTPFRFIDAGIAEIPLWIDPYTVNNSKSAFADTEANNFYFSTSAMGLTTNLEPEGAPDLAHYDSQSALALGKKFAEFIP